MLRLLKNLSLTICRAQNSQRLFAVQMPKNFDDLDRDKKLKILELEISILQQDGRKAPDPTKLKPEQWEHILGLPTKSSRQRYYQYLWQIEVRKSLRSEKKELRKAENEIRWEQERQTSEDNEHIHYGINRNTMFLRIYDAAITAHNNARLIQSMMFEQKLIIDCSYDDYMNSKEAVNAGKQLMLCFAENRLHLEPFDLHLCNFNINSIASKALHNHIPTLLDPEFPLNIHSESLTEKFDKNRLVYLTPHCQNELLEYSHDDIYIIGAMVDKMNNEPLSLAKAKKQGLRMAKLPLDKFLAWASGSGKSLTLNQMVSIMLDMKKHGDWKRALRFVPKRKITEYPPKSLFRKHNNHNEEEQRENLNGFIASPSQSRQFSYQKSRNFQRQGYDEHSPKFPNNKPRRNDEIEDTPSGGGDKQFNKYQFELSSWGRNRKVNNVNDTNPKDNK